MAKDSSRSRVGKLPAFAVRFEVALARLGRAAVWQRLHDGRSEAWGRLGTISGPLRRVHEPRYLKPVRREHPWSRLDYEEGHWYCGGDHFWDLHFVNVAGLEWEFAKTSYCQRDVVAADAASADAWLVDQAKVGVPPQPADQPIARPGRPPFPTSVRDAFKAEYLRVAGDPKARGGNTVRAHLLNWAPDNLRDSEGRTPGVRLQDEWRAKIRKEQK